MSFRQFAALFVLLGSASAYAEAPGVYAIRGGTVHPASSSAIPNGTVVVRDGLIEAVGASVAVPPDATTIDVAGAHVYPGLIDAQTSLGFAAPPRRPSRGAPAARPAETPPEPTPDALAIRNVALTDDDLDARRATGVTTVVTAPSAGIFNGQSVILNLGAGPVASRVVRSPAALQISFSPRPTWTFPDSLMGVIAYLRQSFLDAQQHSAARTVYERSPAGLRRPPDDPALEALAPALRREMPVVFVADSDEMMRRALAIAREFNLRVILAGARQAYEMADELRNVPVLVSVKWPEAPADREDREEQPLRLIRERQLAPTTPAMLARSGATFAVTSGSGKAGDFLPGIRKAIENGLAADDALRAATIVPARIFGIERQLGSLERGKIANIVISDKPIFEEGAKVTRLFVDGREIRLPADAARPSESAPSSIDGTWSLTVRAPQGNVAIQVTLRAEDGRLTGSYAGDRGSGELRGGTFDGSAFDFTISAAANEAEMTDWVFRGTVEGDTMTGTVTTTLGNFDFSGSRSQ